MSIQCSALIGQLRKTLGRAGRYRGALVIVLWQAPVGPVADPDGSIGFMLGSGLDHVLQLSCDGSVIDAERRPYSMAAVEADYDILPGVRVAGAGGLLRGGGPGQDRGFGGVLLRYDASKVSLGAGAVTGTRVDAGEVTDLALYFRAGSDTGIHAQVDLNPVHGLAPQQYVRAGVGWNATQRNRPSGFAGLASIGNSADISGWRQNSHSPSASMPPSAPSATGAAVMATRSTA